MTKRKATADVAEPELPGTAISTSDAAMTSAAPRASTIMTVETDRLNILSSLDHMDVLQLILSFVGDHQYRFVAAVNRSFRTAYANEFRNERDTYLNTSTVVHAKICFEELDSDTMSHASGYDSDSLKYFKDEVSEDDDSETMKANRECVLCRSAAKHNNLAALMYLKSQDCEWDERTCEEAVKHRDYNVLTWAMENGCPVNDTVLTDITINGHLDMLQRACQYIDNQDCEHTTKDIECSWFDTILFFANDTNQTHILRWLYEKFPAHRRHFDGIDMAESTLPDGTTAASDSAAASTTAATEVRK